MTEGAERVMTRCHIGRYVRGSIEKKQAVVHSMGMYNPRLVFGKYDRGLSRERELQKLELMRSSLAVDHPHHVQSKRNPIPTSLLAPLGESTAKFSSIFKAMYRFAWTRKTRRTSPSSQLVDTELESLLDQAPCPMPCGFPDDRILHPSGFGIEFLQLVL